MPPPVLAGRLPNLACPNRDAVCTEQARTIFGAPRFKAVRRPFHADGGPASLPPWSWGLFPGGHSVEKALPGIRSAEAKRESCGQPGGLARQGASQHTVEDAFFAT